MVCGLRRGVLRRVLAQGARLRQSEVSSVLGGVSGRAHRLSYYDHRWLRGNATLVVMWIKVNVMMFMMNMMIINMMMSMMMLMTQVENYEPTYALQQGQLEEAASSVSSLQDSLGDSQTSVAYDQTAVAEEAVPEWSQAYDDDGNLYYYNNYTGVSQYEEPAWS